MSATVHYSVQYMSNLGPLKGQNRKLEPNYVSGTDWGVAAWIAGSDSLCEVVRDFVRFDTRTKMLL